MAKVNAINNKSEELTIDPGASGDSFVQFDINGTGEFRIGVDDDASDAFKISQGSALGSNDCFISTAAGEITMPLTPAFLMTHGTADTNCTGNGTAFTIGSGNALTEVFDQNNDMTTGGTFTAPVTGKYAFYIDCFLTGCSAATTGVLAFTASNRTLNLNVSRAATSAHFGIQGGCIVDMDASDTCTFVITISGEASDICDLQGAVSNNWISGALVT